jgi:uncharacterized repeat protein (TIGR03803 family)
MLLRPVIFLCIISRTSASKGNRMAPSSAFSLARVLALGALCCICLEGTARSQDFQVIHRFGTVFGGMSNPVALMQATDGYLYGSTLFPDPNTGAAIFRMTPAGVITRTWAGFVLSPLTQARNGELYGVGTVSSPVAATGVFKIGSDDSVQVVHAFDESEFAVQGGIIEGIEGDFYGTTMSGGQFGYGTIFRMTPDGAVTFLHAFTGEDGSGPRSALTQAPDGSFFGTTPAGGAFGLGTVFRMTSDGTLTVLHHFSGIDGDGASPFGALVHGFDGKLYGTTTEGGELGHGTVFQITPEGAMTVVYSFSGGLDGSGPEILIQMSDSRLCGTTERNMPSRIYCITPTGAFTLLHTMDSATEGYGSHALVHGFDGYFYGVAAFGLTGGTVFRLRNPFPCDAALTATYRENTLNVRFTLRTETPAFYGAWLVAGASALPLFTASIPTVTPAHVFDIPFEGVSGIGDVGLFALLVTSTSNVCIGWQSVDTGGITAQGSALHRVMPIRPSSPFPPPES